jgi:hypothetical protein
MSDGDAFLEFLADHQPPYLLGLDISGSKVTGAGLRHLARFDVMRWLDVSGTKIGRPALQSLISVLPTLEWLNVKRTRMTWLGRWRLHRANPRLKIVAERPSAITLGTETFDFIEPRWEK